MRLVRFFAWSSGSRSFSAPVRLPADCGLRSRILPSAFIKRHRTRRSLPTNEPLQPSPDSRRRKEVRYNALKCDISPSGQPILRPLNGPRSARDMQKPTSRYSGSRKVPEKIYCVMIWDTQSQEIVGTDCYAVLKLPPAGELARFDTYTAQYVGF